MIWWCTAFKTKAWKETVVMDEVNAVETRPEAAGEGLIFVVGCGRSGTHWLGHLLGSHPDVEITVEVEPLFSWSTSMALDPGEKATLFGPLLERYRELSRGVAPKRYADKSHPNLWLAEDLASAFPKSLFIGIHRSVFGTVASMLLHPGVQKWFQRWREFPVPNAFLGITEENRGRYENLPLVVKCALRWKSHREEMLRVSRLLQPRFHVVYYEELATQTEQEMAKLSAFLGISENFGSLPIRSESLDKWKVNLSAADIHAIEAVVNDKLG
jgi:sulfotransferase family protein